MVRCLSRMGVVCGVGLCVVCVVRVLCVVCVVCVLSLSLLLSVLFSSLFFPIRPFSSLLFSSLLLFRFRFRFRFLFLFLFPLSSFLFPLSSSLFPLSSFLSSPLLSSLVATKHCVKSRSTNTASTFEAFECDTAQGRCTAPAPPFPASANALHGMLSRVPPSVKTTSVLSKKCLAGIFFHQKFCYFEKRKSAPRQICNYFPEDGMSGGFCSPAKTSNFN